MKIEFSGQIFEK